MHYAVLGARILLGLIFTVFGLNYWLHFLPHPELSESAGALLFAFDAAGYMWPLIKITEVIAGVLLLTGFLVPLALILLAPVVVHIVAFHLFLDLAGLPIGLFTLALGLFLAWAYRDSFREVLAVRATPTA